MIDMFPKFHGLTPLRWIVFFLVWMHGTQLDAATSWSRFRGPNGSGVMPSSIQLSKLEEVHIDWTLDLPGEGHSSPVLWANSVYLTSMSPADASFHVLAIDVESGKVNWSREVAYESFSKHDFNSFASPTAAVDEDGVYILWARPDHFHVASLDHAGNWRWNRDLGPFESQHGVGVSPILNGHQVIVANDQLGKSFLMAMDKATGSPIWQTPRKSDKASYSTPCLHQASDGTEQLIFNSAADGITAIDPSDGRKLWSYAKAFDKRSCSSPIVAGGRIFGSCGSGGGGNYVVAVVPPTDMKQDKVQLAYEIRRSANYVPTPIAVKDCIFFWSDGGILTAADPVTGKVHYQERVGGRYFGSPVSTGDEIACVSTTGELVVVAASSSFQLLHRLDLGALCHSTPAIAEDALYVRTISKLHKFHQP